LRETPDATFPSKGKAWANASEDLRNNPRSDLGIAPYGMQH